MLLLLSSLNAPLLLLLLHAAGFQHTIAHLAESLSLNQKRVWSAAAAARKSLNVSIPTNFN